jgi:tetratricopeptide (TPR) repeat protein
LFKYALSCDAPTRSPEREGNRTLDQLEQRLRFLFQGLFMRSSLLSVSLALLLAGGAMPAPLLAPSMAIAAIEQRETQHIATVKVAIEAVESGGLQALEAHVPSLQRVLDEAPPSYPNIELKDGVVQIRAIDMTDFLVLSLAAGQAHRGRTAIMAFNTYPTAAFLLGSIAVAQARPEEALTALNRGLALQPEHDLLVSEKIVATTQLGRHEEAFKLVDQHLQSARIALSPRRALFLRHKGYALIELKRLDEAEASYKAALKLEPNHRGSKNQLAYIKELRKGVNIRGRALLDAGQARDGFGAPPTEQQPSP